MGHRLFASAVAGLVLAGCATTSGLAPRSERSGFDGARVVTVDGHGVACRSMSCPGLGAQWSDKNPTVAIVTVHMFNEIRGITGAQIAVDGRTITLPAHPGLTAFSRPGDPIRESRRNFTMQLADLRAVASATKAWIRVQTTDGYVEEAIVDGATDSKALHAVRRFLAEVDGQPRQ